VTLPTAPRSAFRRLDKLDFPLQTLHAVQEVRAYLIAVETAAIRRARELSGSPTDIAEALGISRQAVYNRLRSLADEGETTVVVPDLEPTDRPSP